MLNDKVIVNNLKQKKCWRLKTKLIALSVLYIPEHASHGYAYTSIARTPTPFQ